MRATRIDPGGRDGYAITECAAPSAAGGEVVLGMLACTVNYRDLLIRAQPVGGYAGDVRGRIPLSDGVGVVLSVGPGVEGVKPGDRVMPCFYPDWDKGPIRAAQIARSLGGTADGVLAERCVFPARSLVAAPPGLNDEEAAALPCAAVTAWSALVEHGRAETGQTVLVQGTGGVSIFALQIAKALGLRVIVLSSSAAKLERARGLGADCTINYRSTPDWAEAIREHTCGAGADYVLDVGGEATLAQSLRALGFGGHLTVIGLLTGAGGSIAQGEMLGRGQHIHGIAVGSRATLEAVSRFVEAKGIRPVIDRSYAFDQAAEAVSSLAEGRHFGKLAVRVQ